MAQQSFEVEVKIRRGFPIIVKGTIAEAEPDIGLKRHIDYFEITTRSGKSADFLNISMPEHVEMMDAVWEKLRG